MALYYCEKKYCTRMKGIYMKGILEIGLVAGVVRDKH